MNQEDLTIREMKVQGKKARAVYAYKPTMNDELCFKIDDIIILTQCSEDETWYEGTLNGRTGWFPSNYVQLITDENDFPNILNASNNSANLNESHIPVAQKNSLASNEPIENRQTKSDESIRIQFLNEMKKTEEGFIDEMSTFIRVAIDPLVAAKGGDIMEPNLIETMSTNLDELIKCHQNFLSQLKEIPDDSDAKIGHLLLCMALQFKHVYDSYAKIHPKFVFVLNKNKDLIIKFYEPSFNKLNTSGSAVNLTASTYITKLLIAPFKQLEIYSKLLKEIHRYTPDFHVDRGDVQRALEFYTDLSNNVQEMRKRKEYEADIMASKINKIDENIFQSGESLFLSSVLMVDENGEKKDRILILFPNCLILLEQNLNNYEFDFDRKIPFVSNQAILNTGNDATPLSPKNSASFKSSLLQLKRINSFDLPNNYGGITINKYCFELSNIPPNSTRLLFICSSLYDFKSWIELLTGILGKLQFAYNNKSLAAIKAAQSIKQQTTLDSTLSLVGGSNGQLNSPTLSTMNISSSVNKTCSTPVSSVVAGSPNQNQLNSSQSSSTRSIPFSPTHQPSPITAITSPIKSLNHRKVFSMRPHPPLIPHYQLPSDNSNSSNNTNDTLKRFMYKKPKSIEPNAKYHGAEDDLKLLNVIESFCKLKPRQSVNINIQEAVTSLVNKTNILPAAQRANGTDSASSTTNLNQKYINKLMDDIGRLESKLQTMNEQLNKSNKLNKEYKNTLSSLQKQFEQERSLRVRLESFVRKNFKSNNDFLANNNTSHAIVNVEHESSI